MKRYELSVQKNIRDLGGLVTSDGHHIKYGRLYRGGLLATVNEEDVKVIDSFHLTDIVDFRGEDEYLYRPDYRFKGATYHNLPALHENVKQEDRNKDDGNLLWFVGDHTSGFEHLKECYRGFVRDEEPILAYTKFFELLLQDDRVTYFHCSQGKDRAGFAAYLIEIALGVSIEDAKEDYLLTNIAMEKRVDALLNSVKYKPFYNEQYHKDLLDVFSAKIEYLEESIKLMDELYGGTMNFIKDILHVDIERLKQLYLE